MEEIIVHDTTNDFLCLKIPVEYSCVYDKLINDLSSIGLKGLTDCKELSSPYSKVKSIIDSWNMFQIACAAYEVGEADKADIIINFINKKMIYCCPVIVRKYNKTIYYNQVDEKPNTTIILAGNESGSLTGRILMTSIYKVGHYFAIPSGVGIKTVENTSFVGDWLYNRDLNIDLYTREDIILNGESYVLWYCEFVIPFNAGVEVILDI